MESLVSVFGKSLSGENEGTILGPFLPLMPGDPYAAQTYTEEAKLAILATASSYGAPFVLHARPQIGHSAGLSMHQILMAAEGKLPAALGAEEHVTCVFSKHLAEIRGPGDASIWEKARDSLGIEVVASLTHVVGACAYLCLF
ncbi:MAG: hypothetical protein Q9204_003691 [Flavoplaca sp. TL-2023a]